MEMISNSKQEQKTSRNKKPKSTLMIYINLPINSFSQIITKNPNIVNTIDNNGETLLSYAIKGKKNDICQCILTSKLLDLKYQDKNGNTYLHLAVLSKLEKIIQILIEKGININKQNQNGNTSLHLAYLKNFETIISILRNNNADVNIKNKDKKLAEDLKVKKNVEFLKQASKGRTTKANSKAKEKNSNNNSKLTAKSSNNNNIKKNVKSIKESNFEPKNLKINILFKYDEKTHIKKIESLPTLRDTQKRQKIDGDQIKNNTSLNMNKRTDIGKKSQTKKSIKENSSNDKKSKEDSSINKKKINLDIGNNTSLETKFKSGTNKDKVSKINNIEEQDKLDDNNILNINKEDDIFGFDIYKQLEFNDLNNQLKKYPFLNMNKGKEYQEEDEINKKEAYERINKKYIDEIIKSSRKDGKDSDENSSQIRDDDEYCVRFDDNKNSDSSDEENIEKNKSSLNFLENSLILNSNNKNNNQIKTRNNNNKEIKLESDINKDNFFFDLMEEKQFSKTLVKESNNQKLDKLSNKSSEDNNNEYENQLAYQLYPDKDQKYNMNLKNLLNKNITNDNNDIKISEDLKEPLLFPELDQIPKDIKEIENIVTNNNSLKEFLSQINMQKYMNVFIDNGFDDMKIILEQAEKGIYIKDSELKEAGILKPGDRAKILIRIQEKAGNFKYAVPKSVYYTCKNFDKINNDINIKNLRDWLKNLRIDNYLNKFIKNGYHSIELLFLQMESESPLTAEILKEEIGIDKIGHRSRIINKLKEDGRSYINKLKTSILLVGNANNSKFCDCVVF